MLFFSETSNALIFRCVNYSMEITQNIMKTSSLKSQNVLILT